MQAVGWHREELFQVARGLPETMFVFDKRDANVIIAVFAKADARSDRNIRLFNQQL